ncbi:MAG: AzlC family protein [Acidimicrobiales bacterium]|nr:AzlC family protein [Acidimicrobiales bacterium]
MTGPDRGHGAPPPPHPITASLVLGLAVGVFGISFGVLAVSAGLSPNKAVAMSLLVFTGASQFAAVAVVQAGGSPLAALGGALLLAARNGAYGLALTDVLRGRLRMRLVAAQLVIDESTAMAAAQHDRRDQRRAFWTAGIATGICWNIGTLIGALGGDAIGDPARFGLDAAFPAGFVALLVPHLRHLDGRRAAALGVAAALVLVPFAPAGVPVLAAGAAALLGLRAPRREDRPAAPPAPPVEDAG